jgi:hypothetical protein
MKVKIFFALVVTVLFIFACSGVKLQKYPSESCVKLPGNKTVSIIKDRCSLCHKGDFATKESICARKGLIIDSVSAGRMPKFGSLKESELKTIVKWEF